MALEKDNSWQSEPPINPPAVDEVKIIEPKGPWPTKSEGLLWVLFAEPTEFVKRYLDYDEGELKQIPQDIRGLRLYTVENLPTGKIGGTEFHRIRQEIVSVIYKGRVSWELEDIYGNTKEFILNLHQGIYIPRFILHTYHTLEESSLSAFANTLLDPDDPRTSDTYTTAIFREMQRKLAGKV